jgi:undecaprenyl diphosphate synthase
MAISPRLGESIPVHLGLILDGNRRWARSQGLPQLEGHRRGSDNLFEIAKAASERGVSYISAFVFSTENWDRTQEEVDYLMDLIVWVATKEIDKYVKAGFRVVFLGSRTRLSSKVIRAIEKAESRTKEGTKTVLALCFNYGGQTELAEGVARLVADGVPAAEVTPERLEQYLYHPEVPPIDFVIRTSGEQRLSGFMMWRASYAELYFCSQPWPAFTNADLDEALAEFARRQRRFGA